MTPDAPVRFAAADLARFSAASHDVNPLHLSESYARRTAFGERVVFGVLGALAALARLAPRPGRALAKLSVEFAGPLFAGVDYAVDLDESSPDRAKVKLRDGRRVVLRLTARFRDGAVEAAPAWPALPPPRTDAADHADAALVAGLALRGRYAAEPAALAALLAALDLPARGVGARHAEALLLASYLVGMELPGRRALFSDLALDFDAAAAPADAPVDWSLSLDAMHADFGMLSMALTTAVGGVASARGKVTAFARRELPAPGGDAVEAAVGRSERLLGKVALVTGASRGLGAAIAHALALQGCTVIGTYLSSAAEADALAARLASTPGRFVAVQGDAGDATWAASMRATIVAEHGRLDLLVCNACPALRPLWIEPASVARITEHVARSVAMVTVPLAHLLDLVAAQGGSAVVVSSSAVDDPPAEWPHYVASKCAVEALARVAAVEQPAARVLVVRPPKLLTELVNTPLGRQDALAPEDFAARLVRRLMDPGERTADGVIDLTRAAAPPSP
jgi:NAD(P)-dependent dehydrogenase (short-subunit alcohol dehydrogenase family)/acyl dehydratase